MKAAKILFTEVGKVAFMEYEASHPKDDQVLIETVYTLVSAGTERSVLRGDPNSAADRGFPRVEGYSAVGYVKEIGSKIKSFKVGDRVFVEYGGHRSIIVKGVNNIYKIPDKVSFEDAVFTKVAGFPLAAIRRARLEIGEAIVVVGLGMLGLFGVQFAKFAGGLPIIAVGNRDIRREKALQLGADYVFSPDEPDLTKKINELTETITSIKGASVIIETSGSEDALINALEYSAKRGRVMLSGCNRVATKPLDLYNCIHVKGVQIVGVHGQTRYPSNSAPGNWTVKRDHITVLRMIENGRLNTKSILSEFDDPRNCADVYNRLLNDRDFPLGVVLDWRKLK